MDHESIDRLCLGLAGTTVGTPFDEKTLVYKVGGRMFALVSTDATRVTLKCDPESATELRERYIAVQAGYHMDKRHWITVDWADEELPGSAVESWIRDSYALNFAKLPARIRAEVAAETSRA